jgi:formylglycine-generating enzyme required for sulfatase activity
MRSTVALLLACVVLASCARRQLGREAPTLELVIENPDRRDFEIFQVIGDRDVVIAPRSSVDRWVESLREGLYEVIVHDEGRAVGLPAPLLENVVPDARLSIRLPRLGVEDAKWVWIPAGVSLVGDILGIGQEDERPAHLVHVRELWFGRHEITNAEYAGFLNDPGVTVDARWLALDSLKCRVKRDDDSGRWTTDAPSMPIVTVSLAGAEAYCEWMTRRTGVRHRLPTEAEWEKAARGPRTMTYDYGHVFRRLAANQESGRLREVGVFGLRGFGLADLTGNAFEWVADTYESGAYESRRGRITEDPVVLRERNQADPAYHVLRGGSFVLDGIYLRNSFRMRQRPTVRTDDIGFRVVREAPPDREEKR